MITRKRLIENYLKFFVSKGHRVIPSSSLIPEHDPTVLFTTAGMHPLVPYILGEKHPLGRRLCSVQKCVRTGDIDEVGDEVHHTFFEMLGNWSLGDYWKKEAIEYSFEFLTKVLKIPIEKIAVSCFAGDKDAPKDTESAEIWMSLGIPKERIVFLPKENNWWGPAGKTGPCGPDTEMFYYVGKRVPKKFNPEDKKWVEIWNDVFMQYIKDEKGNFNLAKQKNVDTGMGVERTIAILQGLDDDYLTDCFLPIINELGNLSGKNYKSIGKEEKRAMRIVADHLKAATFIIGDGVVPSNVERGYVLRRLIRRAIRYAREIGIKENFTTKVANRVIEIYREDYSELEKNKTIIFTELDKEETRFKKTLESGIREFERITKNMKKNEMISGKDSFLLYQSYGFPLEMTEELAKEKEMAVDRKGFEEESKKHQELSRTTSAGIFKSGLADASEKTKHLHTATHLLNEALKQVLGDRNIKQKGSNISPERLRFDFNFGRKLTEKEIKQIEDWVNDKIRKALPVIREEMSLQDALKSGAEAEFGARYPEKVSVYSIIDEENNQIISKEICTGPHVSNTNELGKFKIIKEESSAAGIRRIKAVLE